MCDLNRLTQILDASIEVHAFSGVLSIRHREETLYTRAAGYADRSNKIENTLETRFGIASGTKFFTALAIGKLIATQQLSLATKLKDCIPFAFPRYSEEITLQHLLTHTSGIPDYYDEEQITDFDNFSLNVPWYALKSPRDYLPHFPDEDMKFAPGERFSYSNSGYILLGVVIEEVTGMRYQEFVEQTIFKPIGMNHSGFFAMNRLPEKTAFGYVEEADGWRTNIYNLPIVGASDGGAYTTVQDITTLWKAFWEYKILPTELVEVYSRPYVKVGMEQGKSTCYGHGLWICENAEGNREEYISGCDAGVSFQSRLNRAHGIEVTVISNTTHGAWPLLKDIDTAHGQ